MGKDTKNSNKVSSNQTTNTTTTNNNNDDDATTNRPRNYYITDATSPYTFTYNRYGQQKSIVVHQTPNEETWPGGALWDIGVLMAKLLVQIMDPTTKSRLGSNIMGSWKEKRILELGCGVGLTGLVAAAMGARVTVLTDLTEVIHKVTIPNVEINTVTSGSINNKKSVVAIPLCWGNEEQELQCATLLDTLAPPLLPKKRQQHTKKKKKKSQQQEQQKEEPPQTRQGIPDVVLIGDVAYQHKPGAPSHFDILISTTLKFADEHTIVMFGTRMRMPASADLLDLFKQHFDEVVQPPIEAHEIDPKHFSCGKKHNITVHFFKKRITK